MQQRTPVVTCLCLLALYLIAATMSAQTQAPAQEVQVMVAGPWSFVEDPTNKNRIVIVAPNEPDHFPPTLFPGGDVMNPKNNLGTSYFGKYFLDLSNMVPCNNPPANATNPVHVPNVDVQNVIAPMVKGPSERYGFSLPKPCYFTDLKRMRSKLEVNKLLSSTTADTPYTTWMVFHYSVSTITPAVLTGTSDDKSVTYNTNINFSSSAAKAPSISIVMYGPQDEPTPNDCDGVSVNSVIASGALFKTVIHVWQPSIDAYGEQWIYKPGCQDRTSHKVHGDSFDRANEALAMVAQVERSAHHPNVRQLSKAIDKVQTIKKQMESLTPQPPPAALQDFQTAKARLQALLDKAKQAQQNKSDREASLETFQGPLFPNATAYLLLFTPGSGDCRGAQLDINGVIP